MIEANRVRNRTEKSLSSVSSGRSLYQIGVFVRRVYGVLYIGHRVIQAVCKMD